MSSPRSTDFFKPNGILASCLPNFQHRRCQEDMAEAVENAFREKSTGVIEAGTGTGKTFAYLIPALLCPEKVILSTGTKNLQVQLLEHDIPTISAAVHSVKRIALLKGRGNYLCLHRLKRALEDTALVSRDLSKPLALIQRWSEHTEIGDISELQHIPEDSQIWPWVTSTRDNCLGSECPFLEKCHVAKARRIAQSADILIVNHHLFMADLKLKSGGFGDLLPGAVHVVFDEAHRLPQTAMYFLGSTLSSRQVLDLSSDIQRESVTVRDTPEIRKIADRLVKAVGEARLSFGFPENSGTLRDLVESPETLIGLRLLFETLLGAQASLQPFVTRSKELEGLWTRSVELASELQLFLKPSEDLNTLHWFEVFNKGFLLRRTPIDVSSLFQEAMKCYTGGRVFTSATLAAQNDFCYFTQSLGLSEAHTLSLPSPFVYATQSLIYLPLKVPDPQVSHYTASVVEAAIPVLKISRGRAFFLFTSFKALREAHRLLLDQLEYPLLVQGTMPKPALLDQFRAHGHAILLGTHSFWEGVDIRGEALSCVIIDRLPFDSPDEPLLGAKIEQLRSAGKNPFRDHQLPSAIMTLKQGVGRLIRHTEDYGVLMLCDPRLLLKSYGKRFLGSLPDMPYTRSLADIEHFFEEKERK